MKRAVAAACLPVALLLASCASVPRAPPAQMPPPLEGTALAYAEPGRMPYAVRPGTRTGEYGCAMESETYVPKSPAGESMVMLGHGFMRELSAMRGRAAHWASHGVAVTVVSFCNSKWTAGNHDRNAADLVALARETHSGPVLYVGFSAGGLAAFPAAPGASAGFRVPALFLVGEPSSCNAKSSFLPSIPRRSDVATLRVRNATHGHFENPYDPRVESVCGKVQPREASEDIVRTARALATAWVLDRAAGVEDAGAVLEDARAGRGVWARRIEVVQGGDR